MRLKIPVIVTLRTDRRHRNGHILELDGCNWRCIHCRHWFDAASDADAFWCGDPCSHPATDEVISWKGLL